MTKRLMALERTTVCVHAGGHEFDSRENPRCDWLCAGLPKFARHGGPKGDQQPPLLTSSQCPQTKKRLMGLEPTTFCMAIICDFRIIA